MSFWSSSYYLFTNEQSASAFLCCSFSHHLQLWPCLFYFLSPSGASSLSKQSHYNLHLGPHPEHKHADPQHDGLSPSNQWQPLQMVLNLADRRKGLVPPAAAALKMLNVGLLLAPPAPQICICTRSLADSWIPCGVRNTAFLALKRIARRRQVICGDFSVSPRACL